MKRVCLQWVLLVYTVLLISNEAIIGPIVILNYMIINTLILIIFRDIYCFSN